MKEGALQVVPSMLETKRRCLQAHLQPMSLMVQEGSPGKAKQKNLNPVRSESLLTYSLLARKFSPHQSGILRSRLLHKHTHDVAELGRAVDNPAVQLSVALMRNTHLNDRTEGWNAHF